jgi:hypothetical protein
VYIWEYANADKDTKKSEAIIDEAISAFDELIEKVNAKNVDNQKAHFKGIAKDLEAKGKALIEKVNAL